ncbi:unnamed protein product, partial [Brassica oleracea]
MVLIFHSFKGFSDLEDFWAIKLPENFQKISRTSSRRLSGSLLTEPSLISPFHNRSKCFGKFLCLIF